MEREIWWGETYIWGCKKDGKGNLVRRDLHMRLQKKWKGKFGEERLTYEVAKKMEREIWWGETYIWGCKKDGKGNLVRRDLHMRLQKRWKGKFGEERLTYEVAKKMEREIWWGETYIWGCKKNEKGSLVRRDLHMRLQKKWKGKFGEERLTYEVAKKMEREIWWGETYIWGCKKNEKGSLVRRDLYMRLHKRWKGKFGTRRRHLYMFMLVEVLKKKNISFKA